MQLLRQSFALPKPHSAQNCSIVVVLGSDKAGMNSQYWELYFIWISHSCQPSRSSRHCGCTSNSITKLEFSHRRRHQKARVQTSLARRRKRWGLQRRNQRTSWEHPPQKLQQLLSKGEQTVTPQKEWALLHWQQIQTHPWDLRGRTKRIQAVENTKSINKGVENLGWPSLLRHLFDI